MLPHQLQQTRSHRLSIVDLFNSFFCCASLGMQMGIHTVVCFTFASASFVISLFTPKVYVFDLPTFLDFVLASTRPCHEVMRSQAVDVSWLVLTAHLLH